MLKKVFNLLFSNNKATELRLAIHNNDMVLFNKLIKKMLSVIKIIYV